MSDELQKKIFTENLNRFLAESGKKQSEVAESIGVSPQTFNTWMQGIAIPRMGKIQSLADYFGIKKSDLLEEYKPGTVSPYLSADESLLLSNYRKLDEYDKLKAQGYIEGLASDDKYKKGADTQTA